MLYQGDVNLLQVLDALSYLHSHPLIHGSLTCSNTLVRFDGVIKIGEQPPTCDGKPPADRIFGSGLLGV